MEAEENWRRRDCLARGKDPFSEEELAKLGYTPEDLAVDSPVASSSDLSKGSPDPSNETTRPPTTASSVPSNRGHEKAPGSSGTGTGVGTSMSHQRSGSQLPDLGPPLSPMKFPFDESNKE